MNPRDGTHQAQAEPGWGVAGGGTRPQPCRVVGGGVRLRRPTGRLEWSSL